MTSDEPDQEVWITLRLKGSMPMNADTSAASHEILKRVETFLKKEQPKAVSSFWRRFLDRPAPSYQFTLTQQGDIIEVEEETDIYNKY
jgi:hypothetical protein